VSVAAVGIKNPGCGQGICFSGNTVMAMLPFGFVKNLGGELGCVGRRS
jgi:hypothetical protein